ncbi:MAG: nucleotide exchange factor GrpE [Myxococcota bacterium]
MDKGTNTLEGQEHQGKGNMPFDEDPSLGDATERETPQEPASSGSGWERVETVVDVVAGEGDERSDPSCHPEPPFRHPERSEGSPHVPTGVDSRFRGNDNGGGSDKESDQSQTVQREPTQDQAARELAQLKDHHLRLAAEFDNYKRRSEQEWQQKLKYAANGLVRDLLSVLDNLEQATSAAQAALQQADHAPLRTLLEGMRMVRKQLDSALRQQGVRSLDPVGKPFDPNRHEAVGQQPDDSVAPGTVLQQAQAGYLLHDRLVRPARVVVAAPAGGTVDCGGSTPLSPAE